jgi:CubicO group peptidase (beta-lactamase class C family)
MPMFAHITEALQAAVDTGVFPGAVLMVRLSGQFVYQNACGLAAIRPVREPVLLDTIYDLASLTKPLATATAVLCLVEDRRLSLEDPLEEILEELTGKKIGRATIFHLLNHSSGLPAWRPLYERVASEDRAHPGFLGSPAARRMAVQAISEEPLEYETGSASLYSDLGFILLGMVVERVTGSPLEQFCEARIYRPAQVHPLFFPGNSTDGRHFAPTEEDPWRRRMLRGEVHDENAYALGGAAGHAGLFGTAQAVLGVAGLWLRSYLGQDRFLSPTLVRRFVSRQATPRSTWALGWDTPSAPSSSGRHFSSESFGHLGFTGTSLWIDPVRELEVVLLSNRVHPTRRNTAIQRFRPLIHDAIYEDIVGRAGGDRHVRWETRS